MNLATLIAIASTLLALARIVGASENSADQVKVTVPRHSFWKFYYNGPVATNWIAPDYNDSDWPGGLAQLGYGEGDEQTTIIDDPGFEPTTTYFRHKFAAADMTPANATLRLLADDGAIVYLNGVEIWRRNMPSGAINYSTWALTNLQTNENTFVQFGFFISSLRASDNLIAVEVHQAQGGGADCSFDLELLQDVPKTPPLITITSPIDGAVVTNNAVLIQTAVSDADGHITDVKFYADGALLGAAATEAFSWTWENPSFGRHTITATVSDNTNLRAYSQRVHVQIGTSNAPVKLVRGPYLQSGSATGMVLRWRTDWLTDSVVRYGTNIGQLDCAVTNGSLSADHEVAICGLSADTRYFYAIGSSAASGSSAVTFASGSEYSFRTSPTNTRPLRIWVIGDSGTGNSDAAAVRDAFQEYQTQTGITEPPDLWVMLGDNAYPSGTDEEYQRAVFEMYTNQLPQIPLWPTLGNHDAGESVSDSPATYFDIFSLPKNGEAGGLPSGTELYYSFDYANIHFICLDSQLSNRTTNGPMATWLRSDLAATDKDWILAFWHHPPYSWAEHNSDLEGQQIEMREQIVPILEEYGVDLVLSGHSHSYERSFLLNGHYGYAWQFEPSMALDSTLGRVDDTGPYRKPSGGLGARSGTVYSVCGCSGAGNMGSFALHPAMARNYGGFGCLIIDIDGLQLTTRFVRAPLGLEDYFTIDKSAPASIRPQVQITPDPRGSHPFISWPTSNPTFSLESTDRLPSNRWEDVAEPIKLIGRHNIVTLDSLATNRIFRLRAQH